MRLEFEQNHTQSAYADGMAADTVAEERAAEAADHLRAGIKAAQAGNRAAARTSLLRAAELDPRSESTWLWLSSISEYPEELLAFLSNVLEINPLNARALEWSAATKSLLAKNFVQRGIDAAESGQNEIAAQHFNQALEYDEKNSMAWLWLASLSDSNEGKLSYLEKVLEFDPENETAKAGLQAARNGIREKLLAEARAAAVAGDSVSANELLDAIIAEEPGAEDAWVLKSHIAIGFEEKIAAFRRILEINPDNTGAKSGLESLTSIMDAVGVKASVENVVEAAADDDISAASAEEFVRQEVSPAVEEVEENSVFAEPQSEGPSAASPFNSFAEEEVPDFSGTIYSPSSAFETVEEPVVEAAAEQTDLEPVEAAVPDLDFVDLRNRHLHVEHLDKTDELPDFVLPEAELAYRNSGEPEEITFDIASETMDAEPESIEEPVSWDARAVVQPAEQFGPKFVEVSAISAPTSNPFEGEEFRSEPEELKTILSHDLEAEMQAAVQNLDLSDKAADNGSHESNGFNVPFDAERYSGTIPMPESGFENLVPVISTGFETRVVGADETRIAATSNCAFCDHENDFQAIVCQGCLSVLTLADLELVLANHHADKTVVRQAVERMEREKATRDFTEAELTMLGIGHLNLRNLQYGYNCLHEAAQKNPNNVVLSGQVNALLIRLDEIKQQDEAHGTMAKGKIILVVDDSPTVRKLIAGKLEKCGHQVFCSGDGVEAMVKLGEIRPDLVLLDITMPRMDGYQVCKLIRGNEATKNVPVVMISGKDGFFDKVRGRMAGSTGYITKPFGPETLMKAVESYLNPVA